MVPLDLRTIEVRLSDNDETNDDITKIVQLSLDNKSPVTVRRITGGITNQLLLASQGDKKVLIRAFGHGTDNFIDRSREYSVHCQLHGLGLAPTLFSRFSNGLVYDFAPGRSTKPEELSHPNVMAAVASHLYKWHDQLKWKDIAAWFTTTVEIDNESEMIYTTLRKWAILAPPGVVDDKFNTKEKLLEEIDWIKKVIGEKGGPIVIGHCDLLSGNIIINDPIESVKSATFIDYEYAMPVPRAFDLANHFWEWQGFDCVRDRVPVPDVTNDTLRTWGAAYLHSTSNSEQVTNLIKEVRAWWGMPGFYWGIWAAIQSVESDIDFDYAGYARLRFSEYSDWKSNIYPTLKD